MATMGDPANEPGNPDGCRISKESVKKTISSLGKLSSAFIKAAEILATSARAMAQSIKAIGKAGGAKGRTAKEPPHPDVAKRIDDLAVEKYSIALNERGIKRWGEAKKKEESERKRYYDEIAKQEEKALRKKMQQLASFQNKSVSQMERFKKSEAAAQKSEDEQIANARYKWGRALADQAKKKEREEKLKSEKEKSERKRYYDEIAKQEEKALRKKMQQLASFQNKSVSQMERFKKSEAAAQKSEDEQIANARYKWGRALADQAEKKEREKLKLEQDRFAQEQAIMRKAPIAYGVGKAFGFLSASLFKLVQSAISSMGSLFGGRGKGGETVAEGFASGGKARGTDTVPAMLTPGEFVVSKKGAKKNRGALEAMNKGAKYYAVGGLVAAGARAVNGVGVAAAVAGKGAAAGAEAAGASGMAAAFDMVTAAMGPAGLAAKALKFALVGPVDLFNQLLGAIGPFVQAVNPALMQQLSMVMKDLQAVIGSALQPIIAAAIPIIRAFADRLKPVMDALMPTFDTLASSMIELAGPVIEILIEAFAALEPVITVASGIIQGWAQALTAALPAIIWVMKAIVSVFLSVVTTIQYVVGWLASWIPGMKKFGASMMESSKASQVAINNYVAGTSKVQKVVREPVRRGASVGAAARTASFSGISDFGKNLMQQAFSTGTQAATLKTAEYTEKTYGELAKMNANLGRGNPAAPAAGVRRGA